MLVHLSHYPSRTHGNNKHWNKSKKCMIKLPTLIFRANTPYSWNIGWPGIFVLCFSFMVYFYATLINNFNLFNLSSTLLRFTYVFLIAHSLLSIIIIFFYVGSPPRGDHNVHDQPAKQYRPFCCLNTLWLHFLQL